MPSKPARKRAGVAGSGTAAVTVTGTDGVDVYTPRMPPGELSICNVNRELAPVGSVVLTREEDAVRSRMKNEKVSGRESLVGAFRVASS
jgi:hypothetical protein